MKMPRGTPHAGWLSAKRLKLQEVQAQIGKGRDRYGAVQQPPSTPWLGQNTIKVYLLSLIPLLHSAPINIGRCEPHVHSTRTHACTQAQHLCSCQALAQAEGDALRPRRRAPGPQRTRTSRSAGPSARPPAPRPPSACGTPSPRSPAYLPLRGAAANFKPPLLHSSAGRARGGGPQHVQT